MPCESGRDGVNTSERDVRDSMRDTSAVMDNSMLHAWECGNGTGAPMPPRIFKCWRSREGHPDFLDSPKQPRLRAPKIGPAASQLTERQDGYRCVFQPATHSHLKSFTGITKLQTSWPLDPIAHSI